MYGAALGRRENRDESTRTERFHTIQRTITIIIMIVVSPTRHADTRKAMTTIRRTTVVFMGVAASFVKILIGRRIKSSTSINKNILNWSHYVFVGRYLVSIACPLPSTPVSLANLVEKEKKPFLLLYRLPRFVKGNRIHLFLYIYV